MLGSLRRGELKFEVDLIGGSDAPARLKEFLENSTLVLRTDEELIIMPSSGIECITLEIAGDDFPLHRFPAVRTARRVQES